MIEYIFKLPVGKIEIEKSVIRQSNPTEKQLLLLQLQFCEVKYSKH